MKCFSGNAEQLANDADNNAAERTAAACSTVNTTVSTSSGTAEQPAALAVNPKDAVADSPMLRGTFHTIIATSISRSILQSLWHSCRAYSAIYPVGYDGYADSAMTDC